MRKVFKILLVPVVMLCFTLTISSSLVSEPKISEEFVETEEAIYCKKTTTDPITGIISETVCWFCNCSKQ